MMELKSNSSYADTYSKANTNTAASWALLVTRDMRKKYSSGQVIIREGERDRALYMLKSGNLGILKSGKLVSRIEKPGEIFGEMSVVLDHARTATVTALTPCIVDVFDIGLEALARDHPDITKLVMRTLAKRLAETTARLHTYMLAWDKSEAAVEHHSAASFSNLLDIDDRIIQHAAVLIDDRDLIAVLSDAKSDIRDKILRNLSKQRAAVIKEKMQVQIRTQKSVKRAQHHVMEEINRLITTWKQTYGL